MIARAVIRQPAYPKRWRASFSLALSYPKPMYSLEQLQHKTFRQLKEIGFQLNVLPEGDRRCRQNWIDVIAGINPPLLELLEVEPVEVEPVEDSPPLPDVIEASSPIHEPIEHGRITGYLCRPKPIEIQAQEPTESKFGRIVYPRPAVKPIASAAESEAFVSQMAIAQVVNNSPGVETQSPDRWAKPDRWNPADFGEVPHTADAGGQLNLLEWDVSEPPDPDDYDLMTDFHDAYDRWLLEEQVREVFKKSDANNASTTRTGTEQTGTNEIAIAAELPSGCDNSANFMELAAITKMKDWEAKRAIAFWKKAGLIHEIQGEFYHISHLN